MTTKWPVVLATPAERSAEREADRVVEYKLTEWKREDDAGASLTVGEPVLGQGMGGWGVLIPWPSDKPDGRAGARVRIYGSGEVYGLSLLADGEWVPIFYRTKREREAEFGRWISDNQRRQHEEFEKNRATMDAAYEALPAPLKRRIDRFRAEDSDFRWKDESYEMAACSEAGRLWKRALDPAFGKALKAVNAKGPKPDAPSSSWDWGENDGTTDWEDTPENRLIVFDALNSKINGYNFKLMHELMPEMDEGHSGNTWGHAFMFALRLVRGQGDQL
jgi:hypothetical protein